MPLLSHGVVRPPHQAAAPEDVPQPCRDVCQSARLDRCQGVSTHLVRAPLDLLMEPTRALSAILLLLHLKGRNYFQLERNISNIHLRNPRQVHRELVSLHKYVIVLMVTSHS